MNKLKRLLLSLAALLLFSGIAIAAPVAARDRNALADDTSSSTTTDNQSNDLAQQFKEQAKAKLEAARQNAKEQTEAHREHACTARKAALEHRMSRAVTQAKKHKAVFDKIYAKVKDFYTNKNLNVPDYASLTAAVDTAGTNAQTSIDALAALDVNVDCTSQTVASSVSAFQQAVSNTRDSLKAYRKTITGLTSSLKGASTGTNSPNDSATNTTAQ
jgi:hypothetical protein